MGKSKNKNNKRSRSRFKTANKEIKLIDKI